MGKDRMERRGHHEARAPPLPCGHDAVVRVRIPLEEPRKGLGLDVHGRDARLPFEVLLNPSVGTEDRVRPVPTRYALSPDPESDWGVPLLESRRLQRVRLR